MHTWTVMTQSGQQTQAWEVKEDFLEEERSKLRHRVRMKSWESVPNRRTSMCSGLEARKPDQLRKLKFVG